MLERLRDTPDSHLNRPLAVCVSCGREPMAERSSHVETAFVFDLDGTLVDSVYQHVLAWREALEAEGIELAVWRIHRRIGMSGGLFTNLLLRETGVDFGSETVERLQRLHAAAYERTSRDVRPLPGARALLAALSDAGIPWAVATSGRMQTARTVLDSLGIDLDKTPVVTRDQVRHAKPDPDLFLAAAARLGVPAERATVVGDSVWDMLAATRARSLGIGLLSGGYGMEELERAGAYRVFEDPADLLKHLDEVGGRK
jgi:HAD superfamily hydrolase (TIGR01509 family)